MVPRLRRELARVLGHEKLNGLVRAQRGAHRSDRYAALEQLTARHPDLYGGPNGLSGQEARVFSQNGEDGVLGAIFGRIGPGRRTFVEFGIQDGREGNAVLLADVARWSGLFIEADPTAYAALSSKYRHCERVRTLELIVNAENLDDALKTHGLFEGLDLLSIDVDGADYWIWRGSQARPRVVVIEYNSSLGLDARTQPAHIGPWDGTDAFGASLEALRRLGTAKGYRLVHAELAGVNAFFVREDEAARAGWSSLSTEAAYQPANYGLEGRAHPAGMRDDWVAIGEDGEPEPAA